MLAASPFSDESHTGDAIEAKTETALDCAEVSGLKHERLFFPVSDNGANMVAGWEPFGGGRCGVHTGQLSVMVFLEHQAIKPTRDKQKGIVAHFNKSTGVDGLNGLHKCQRSCQLPVHHPVSTVATRWSSDHDQMEWFRYEQAAVQLYDVNHSRKAGDAYRQYQLGLEDWRISEQSVAVLQPVADWTQHMQGTKYPTMPLALPTVYELIDGMAPASPLNCSFAGVDPYVLQPGEMHQGVLAARTEMYKDWYRRWVTELRPAEAKKVYAISTLLHPFFKDYSFIDAYSFVDASDKAWALGELRSEWRFEWKNKPITTAAGPSHATAATPTPEPTAAPAPVRTTVPTPPTSGPDARPVAPGGKKVTLGSLLGKKAMIAAPSPTVVPVRDELEEYLSSPLETDMDLDLLKYWKLKETTWPKLAKMAKQYLAAPFSSGFVERVFSAAGKMHDDLRKSEKDSTLEHSLFAAFNIE